MLLGPPPEEEEAFWRPPDGTPMERPKQEPDAEARPPNESHAEKISKPRKPRTR
jgi:hypothetical protein